MPPVIDKAVAVMLPSIAYNTVFAALAFTATRQTTNAPEAVGCGTMSRHWSAARMGVTTNGSAEPRWK